VDNILGVFGLEIPNLAERLGAIEPASLRAGEEVATQLRHTIARNPENSRKEQVELEGVKQWIAIRQNRDSESES
jgi:hypothetical protein